MDNLVGIMDITWCILMYMHVCVPIKNQPTVFSVLQAHVNYSTDMKSCKVRAPSSKFVGHPPTNIGIEKPPSHGMADWNIVSG